MSRVGLITGCGKGIGLACLKEFLSSDKENVALGISRSKTYEVEVLKSAHGSNLYFLEADINDHERINSNIREFVAQAPLDFAICNAGIRSRISIHDSTLDRYRQVLETNTISQVNIVKTLTCNRDSNSKLLNILVLSSIVGQRGFSDLSTYGVSKAALEGFVKSAAVELAPKNVLINSLNPGFVKSSYEKEFIKNNSELYNWTLEKTPLGRWGDCIEIAKIALFLTSESNTFMTGSTVYCDGGWSA